MGKKTSYRDSPKTKTELARAHTKIEKHSKGYTRMETIWQKTIDGEKKNKDLSMNVMEDSAQIVENRDEWRRLCEAVMDLNKKKWPLNAEE